MQYNIALLQKHKTQDNKNEEIIHAYEMNENGFFLLILISLLIFCKVIYFC